MNVVNSIRFYIKKMTEESGHGMKILLLDQETVSLKYSFNKSIDFIGRLNNDFNRKEL